MAQAVIDHPTFIKRLHWKYGEQVPIETVQVAESIAQAPEEAVFFCDNSVFDEDLDPAITEALLEVPGRMVLTPFVMAELQPWLRRHLDHPLARAMLKDEAKPQERTPPPENSPGRTVYQYYLWLLLMRRRAFEVAEDRFRREHDRPPDEDERQALRDEVHKDLGPRGFLLAKKGFSKLPTDEALVYLAVEYALSTGRPTMILTADADVEEQFAKLVWLINTHYRGMLLADRYASDFASFKPQALPRSFASHPACPFEREGTVLIERGHHDLQHVLPPRPHCVPISCWRVGRYFSAMTFMAEQEMNRLLEVKDRTGGLSTELLGGRNLHPWLAPLPLRAPEAGCAAVARDKRVPLPEGRASIARHDITQTVTNLERHTIIKPARRGPVTIDSSLGTPVVYNDLIVIRDTRRNREKKD